ncbi:MAG: DNA repair protein RecN [Lachnospiraceae bacterium]|nr:DNA repair protein RecN [Lachnospiraceae bacterium]
MLLNMHIKNIALIDDIDVSFNEGLNILTGETGAGKSIIIGSLGICLGGKFQKELLRDEEKDGLVELLFSVDNDRIKNMLLSIDVDPGEEDEILISRRLNQAGKTINRINDNTVTVGKLKEVAGILIDLHAQHEQQTLLKKDKHLVILDRFGGKNIEELKSQVNVCYKEYIQIKDKLEKDSIDEAEKNKQMDFLKYQINEIKSANLISGEDEELEIAYRKAVNSKDILSTADGIYQSTGYEVGGTGDAVGRALQQLGRLIDLDPDLVNLHETLGDIDGMLNDFNRELSAYMKSLEFDGQEFAALEQRLDLINSLKAKYGNSIETIMNTCDEYEKEYNKLLSYEEYIDSLNIELNNKGKILTELSDKLTKARMEAGNKLSELIKASLQELNFLTVEFDMKFEKLDHFTANGMDDACFMISTNVGEPMRPLYEVASGGELSRVMLAIKSCLAYEDDTPTLVFDEIDVGISGRTAQKVAEKMSLIGKSHQVICITHLPQIAAMADSHYSIEKNVENSKTITNIRILSREEQIGEIARLLGGAEITDATIVSATEMKGLADKAKLY